MGSQLREQADVFANTVAGPDRDQWIDELGSTLIYKLHRSFSWSLLITAGLLLFWVKRAGNSGIVEPKLAFAMVVAMMMMGFVLAHISDLPVVQVLHVAVTAVLLAVTWHWIIRLGSIKPTGFAACDLNRAEPPTGFG